MGAFKRGKSWYIDYTIINKNGVKKRIREAVSMKKSEAVARLGKVTASMRENRFFDVRKEYNHTFDELMLLYLEGPGTEKRSAERDRFSAKRMKSFSGSARAKASVRAATAGLTLALPLREVFQS